METAASPQGAIVLPDATEAGEASEPGRLPGATLYHRAVRLDDFE
jgi:hypothetical protein